MSLSSFTDKTDIGLLTWNGHVDTVTEFRRSLVHMRFTLDLYFSSPVIDLTDLNRLLVTSMLG